MSKTPRTAIVTLTHIWSRAIKREHEKRVRQGGAYGDVWLLYHRYDASMQTPVAPRVECMTRRDLDRLHCPPPPVELAKGGLAQLFMLEFARRHPDYDRYWFIEFDVRFSGDWALLFEATDAVDADLLAPCVRTRDQHPDWKWWQSLTHPREVISDQKQLRCLNVICRLSARACKTLDETCQHGWNGHSEVLFPTILSHAGMTVADLGGRGLFTPEPLRGRFYREGEDRPDGLRGRGTMRVAPPRLWCGFVRNVLYHPVKPFNVWLHRRMRWVREIAKRRLGI